MWRGDTPTPTLRRAGSRGERDRGALSPLWTAMHSSAAPPGRHGSAALAARAQVEQLPAQVAK